MPAASQPKVTGKWCGNLSASLPSRTLASTGFSEAALIRSSTPSGATGGGSSSSSSSLSRPPHSLIAIARIPHAYPAAGGAKLPAIMGEGLVGLRHAEDVVLALVRTALLGLRVQQLVR